MVVGSVDNLAGQSFFGYGENGQFGYNYNLVTADYQGLDKISLTDLIQTPQPAIAQVISNVQANALNFAVQATIFEFGQRFTRKLLSRSINKVNNMVFTGKMAPLRGLGVRI
jgi:hypothetical protein